MSKRFERGPSKIQMRAILKETLREYETTAQDIIDVSGWVRVRSMDDGVIDSWKVSFSIDSREAGKALVALYEHGMANIQGGWLYLSGPAHDILEAKL